MFQIYSFEFEETILKIFNFIASYNEKLKNSSDRYKFTWNQNEVLFQFSIFFASFSPFTIFRRFPPFLR